MRRFVQVIRGALYAPFELTRWAGLPCPLQAAVLRVVMFLDRPLRRFLVSGE